jgi:hypothetical protein
MSKKNYTFAEYLINPDYFSINKKNSVAEYHTNSSNSGNTAKKADHSAKQKTNVAASYPVKKSFPPADKVTDKKERAIEYEGELYDAGDKTKSVVLKATVEGKEEAKRKKFSPEDEAAYTDNYVKAKVSEDNSHELYNNAVINMAKLEAKSGDLDPSSRKTTETLASMESKDIPMSEYIKAKDESDYKKGTFTTTRYASSVYSDELKEYQRKLNEAGITDKFGDAVDEDGLWGAQTASATKKLVEAAETSDERGNLAREILEVFSDTVSNFGHVGKGIYMTNYFSPTSIEENKFFNKNKNWSNGSQKEYTIDFGKKSSNRKNTKFAIFDNKRKDGNTRIFAIESHGMDIGTKGNSHRANTPHYHIIKDAYTPNELNKVSKVLGYENADDFLKNKFIEEKYSSDTNLHIHAPESAVKKAKAIKGVNTVLDTAGKAMFWIGIAHDTARISKTIYDDITDDNSKIDKKTVSTVSDVAGSWAGAALGASVGAKAGAAIGSLIFPAVGTAIGGAIGSAVGGAVGAICGGKGASWTSEKIYDKIAD